MAQGFMALFHLIKSSELAFKYTYTLCAVKYLRKTKTKAKLKNNNGEIHCKSKGTKRIPYKLILITATTTKTIRIIQKD